MAYNTGYPPTANVVNHQAYMLGCDMLNVQDRLLTRDKHKLVRQVLEFNLQFKPFTILCYQLEDVVEGRVQCANQVKEVLEEVRAKIRLFEFVAARLGV